MRICRRLLCGLGIAWINCRKAYDLIPQAVEMHEYVWDCRQYGIFTKKQYQCLENRFERKFRINHLLFMDDLKLYGKDEQPNKYTCQHSKSI